MILDSTAVFLAYSLDERGFGCSILFAFDVGLKLINHRPAHNHRSTHDIRLRGSDYAKKTLEK